MKRTWYSKLNWTGRKKRRRSFFASEGAVVRNKTKVSDKSLFISRKRSAGDFVLVRILDAAHLSFIRFLAIEGKVQQVEFRILKNKWELEVLKKEHKLRWEGLFVELEPVSISIFRPYEQLALRQLLTMATSWPPMNPADAGRWKGSCFLPFKES